jgi:hypothetical protein
MRLENSVVKYQIERDCARFGRQLVETLDLDPVYVALHHADLPKHQLHRWLLAYWCLYDVGAASYISEAPTDGDYWYALLDAAKNTTPSPLGGRWPRGKERRHWRGETASKSMSHMLERFQNASDVILHIGGKGTEIKFSQLSANARSIYGFGPWIAFKIGDMMERLCGLKVDFSEAEVFMFNEPLNAALMLWRQATRLPPTAKPRHLHQALHAVVQGLQSQLSDLTAPPDHQRPLGLQEVETILCKWKSHCNGHYKPLNDTLEIQETLHRWEGVSKTAGQLLKSLNTELGQLEPS